MIRRGSALAGAIALTVALAAGCSKDSTSPAPTITGSWYLRTVAGQSLPYDFGNGASAAADDLVVNTNGTYVELFRTKWSAAYHAADPVSYPLDTTYRIEGTWVLRGSVVTFGSSAADVWNATWDRDSLYIQGPSSRAVYRR